MDAAKDTVSSRSWAAYLTFRSAQKKFAAEVPAERVHQFRVRPVDPLMEPVESVEGEVPVLFLREPPDAPVDEITDDPRLLHVVGARGRPGDGDDDPAGTRQVDPVPQGRRVPFERVELAAVLEQPLEPPVPFRGPSVAVPEILAGGGLDGQEQEAVEKPVLNRAVPVEIGQVAIEAARGPVPARVAVNEDRVTEGDFGRKPGFRCGDLGRGDDWRCGDGPCQDG
jgi:hypothetical protein